MHTNQIIIHNITPDELSNHISNAVEAKFKELQEAKALLKKSEEQEDLMSVEETLTFLKCSKQALWNWRKNGILPSYRLGNRVYYKRSDIFKKLVRQE